MPPCEHTGVQIPECSCVHCLRELFRQNRPTQNRGDHQSSPVSTFPGKQPAHVPGQLAFPSEASDSIRFWRVLYYDDEGRKCTRIVAAENDEQAELMICVTENIIVNAILEVREEELPE